jgi:hypothetical protein
VVEWFYRGGLALHLAPPRQLPRCRGLGCFRCREQHAAVDFENRFGPFAAGVLGC